MLRFWFIPTWCGDFRLEQAGENACVLSVKDPTDADLARLRPFLQSAREHGWIPMERGLKRTGNSRIEIPAPLRVVGPILASDTGKGDGSNWTALRFEGGVLSVVEGTDLPPDRPEPEAAATVERPARGCPVPTPAERRASEVLRVFSTRSQYARYRREGRMLVLGSASGRPYFLYHRDEAARRGLSRCLVRLEDGAPICAWDDRVPPEEETLGLKLAVEHRERWLLGLDTGFAFTAPAVRA